MHEGSAIKRPEDLKGKRIGIPEWAQTAGVYGRGYLSDYVGIKQITRGTPNADDDVHVLRGQAWATAISPVEGTSYVTAHAPSAFSGSPWR